MCDGPGAVQLPLVLATVSSHTNPSLLQTADEQVHMEEVLDLVHPPPEASGSSTVLMSKDPFKL